MEEIDFEINKRIIGITRKYYLHEEKNYMLTDRRTTETYRMINQNKRKAYNLYDK